MIQAAGTEAVLKQAMMRSAAIRLSVVMDDKPQSYSARILRFEGDDGTEGVWVHLPENVSAAARLGQALPQCGISVAMDQVRFEFKSKVLRRQRPFWVNDRVALDALLLAPPQDAQQVQQRRAPRFEVSDGSGVSAQLLLLPEDACQQPLPVAGKLRDLSTSGGGFICPTNRVLLQAPAGQRLRCIIQFRGRKIELCARLAHVSTISNRTIRLGFAFDHASPQPSAEAAAIDEIIRELERQRSLRVGRRAG